jgi:hypothetical protein
MKNRKTKAKQLLHVPQLTFSGFSAESMISGNSSSANCSLSSTESRFFNPVRLIKWIYIKEQTLNKKNL